MNRRGFTLIEMLLVVTIIGMMFSVALPASYSMYMRYKASLKAENVLVLLSSLRMNSFLYGEERTVASRNGRITVDDVEPKGYGDFFIRVEKPIRFFRTGTTTGGKIKIYIGDYAFSLNVEAPLGNMTLTQVPG